MTDPIKTVDVDDVLVWDGDEFTVKAVGQDVLPNSSYEHVLLSSQASNDRMEAVKLHERLFNEWLNDDSRDFRLVT